MQRHPAIVHWTEIESTAPRQYSGHDEPMRFNAPFGQHFNFARLGIHHERLSPGRRASFPHAEKTEDEFIYVISGTPDVWINGHLHRLGPGDGVGFPAGTGVVHTFLNNSTQDVELLVVGDRTRADNRIVYPLNPDRRPLREDWWEDAPAQDFGPHDGLTEARRAELARR